MRYKVLINPEAGSGRGRKLIPEIKKLLYKDNLDFEPFEIEKESDLIKNIKSAPSEDYDAIIVVGGDGTVRNALKGISGTELKLGIIPAGNCNTFAKACKIPINYRQAVGIFKKKKLKKAYYGILIRTVPDPSQQKESPDEPDITIIEETPFCSSLSVGPKFMVADESSITLKKPMDRFLAIAKVFGKQFFNYSFPELSVSYIPVGSDDSDQVKSSDADESELDASKIEDEMNESKNEIKTRASSIVISNVADTGSLFKLSRGASAFEPALTMGFLKGNKKMDYLKYFFNHMKDNKPWELPFVEFEKAVKVRVSSMSDDIGFYLDREEFGSLPFSAAIRKESVEVFVK